MSPQLNIGLLASDTVPTEDDDPSEEEDDDPTEDDDKENVKKTWLQMHKINNFLYILSLLISPE